MGGTIETVVKRLRWKHKILLYLDRLSPYEEEIVGPDEATQSGISGRLGFSISYCAEVLKKLEEEGSVVWYLAHIVGNDRKRRKVYRLTHSGIRVAKRLRRDFLHGELDRSCPVCGRPI